jgi:hypothetical protein
MLINQRERERLTEFIATQGISCVVLGPGAVDKEGHTIHESVPLHKVVLASHIHEEIVLRFATLLAAPQS